MQTAVHQKVFHRSVSVLFAFPLIFIYLSCQNSFHLSCCYIFLLLLFKKKKDCVLRRKNGFTSAPFLDLNS